MNLHRIASKLVLGGLLASSLAAVPTLASGTCATSPSTGGDWATHGGDLLGTRNQALETNISAANASTLESKWTTTTALAGGAGNIQTVPIVAEGCVYIQTSVGGNWIIALNADSGEFVWKYQLGSSGCHVAPHVENGIIYINDPTNAATNNGVGPHVVALNAKTGAEIYVGETVATEPNTGANAGCATPSVKFEDTVLIGITNAEMGGGRNGGYAIVDADTGALIKRHYTIPEDQGLAGFSGCSFWGGWSIDPVTKSAYAGTAQPSGWFDKESEMCNAIVKIDLDKTHATYGEIVGAMKGTVDDPPYIDVDFGSAPTIVRDADGRQIVAALQKSGYLHGGYTRHMTHAWSTPVSPVGIAVGNHTASASDGRNVYTVGAYPGQLFSIDGGTGLPNWVTPLVSPIASNAVAYANGVVFYGDEKAFLNAVDASNGVPLFARPLALDTGGPTCTRNQSGGISVARGLVFMACGGVIAAYGLA